MTSDLQNLIELQQIDSQIAALRAEIAALPKHVAEIEAKLAGSKAKVEATLAAGKADEGARRKHESDIQDQQQKISKYRDQSLNVKTNDEYTRADGRDQVRGGTRLPPPRTRSWKSWSPPTPARNR